MAQLRAMPTCLIMWRLACPCERTKWRASGRCARAPMLCHALGGGPALAPPLRPPLSGHTCTYIKALDVGPRGVHPWLIDALQALMAPHTVASSPPSESAPMRS